MALIGYKQTAEHISRRIKSGELHPNWKGDNITVKSGRQRAERMYKNIGACSICGNPKAERHHKDDNTANNDVSNIEILCRRCHMEKDGRLQKFAQIHKLIKNRYRGKLSAADVIEIFRLRKEGLSQSKIGERFGIKQVQVSRILNRKRRTDVQIPEDLWN